jgi:hypothetical protein
VKFSSIVSIQILNLKNENPSIDEIHVENDYFPLPSKFKMQGRDYRARKRGSWHLIPGLEDSVRDGWMSAGPVGFCAGPGG